MVKKVHPFKSFQVKVTASLILAMLVVLFITNGFIYQVTEREQFNILRDRLKVIANTASMMVNPYMLKQVPLNQEGVHSPEFKAIRAQLQKIREVNPQIHFIYTLAKTDQPGILQFVVDADPFEAGSGGATAMPGDLYDATRFPQMLAAFDDGPTADEELGMDEWAVTLSGYAPIKDKLGRVVAILGVDVEAKDVLLIQKHYRERMLAVIIVGIILSLLFGMILARSLSRGIRKLHEGTLKLADGQFDYRVEIHSKDEIGYLARSFNRMTEQLLTSKRRLLEYFFDTVQMLVRVLEAKDEYTRGHSQNVADLSVKIAREMGYSAGQVDLLRKMALLHDIGKVGVDDAILKKKGKLTEKEWDQMRAHPVIGENILKPLLKDEEMLAVVRSHHECYDGQGYPDQLSKDEINIFAAIVAVADAYDAMISNRSYRNRISHDKAVKEIKDNAGKQFHPDVVEAFLKVIQASQNKS